MSTLQLFLKLFVLTSVFTLGGCLGESLNTSSSESSSIASSAPSSSSSSSAPSSRSSSSSPVVTPVDCWLDQSTISRNPNSYPEQRQMPDPFLFDDGSRVSTAEEWDCRRQEISSVIQRIQYGPVPSEPDSVSANYSGSQMTVTVRANGKTASFNASVSKPNGAGPFAAFVVIGGGGFFGMPGITSQVTLARNIAYITVEPNQVAADNGTSGAFYSLYGSASPRTGNLMAWAWAVHRIVDALEGAPEIGINPEKIAVTGYSRYGKAALVAGAFDDRIALTVPAGGGHGGIASWRVGEDNDDKSQKFNGCCETIFEINGAPNWFTDGFVIAWEGDNTYRLPFDAHSIAALVAPRALFVQEGTQDTRNGNGLNVAGPYKSTWAARLVYQFLGAEDKIGFVADAHGHGTMTSRETNAIMDFADQILNDKPLTPPPFDDRGDPANINWSSP